MLTFGGCGGCKKDKDKDEESAQNGQNGQGNEDRPPFEFRDLTVQPSRILNEGPARQYVKPGHWITANKPIIANDSDFQGVLDSDCTNASGDPLPNENTNSHLISSRNVPLAKGQWRDNEVTFYIPRRSTSKKNITLRHQLRAREGGRALFDEGQPVNLLLDFQYLMVVLSDNPDDYAFLRGTNAVVHDDVPIDVDVQALAYYQVIAPKIENRIPLPSQSLAWTSIAYVIWDNPDYSRFNPDQEQALVDWLHYGGQLVISGPDSLKTLRGSFLEDYLPAQAGESLDLTNVQLDELNQYWSIAEKKNPNQKRLLEVNDDAAMIGVELELQPGGRYMNGTGELVAERRVGRGRVVTTGFPLDHRSLTRWKSFDGFLNGCILRRPSRTFTRDQLDSGSFELTHYDGSVTDPVFSTTLRYLSRDISALDSGSIGRLVLGQNSRKDVAEEDLEDGVEEDESSEAEQGSAAPEGSDRYSWFLGGYANSADSGMAGWNDSSGVSRAARNSLEESAGITPPTSKFVRNVLICYLVVLVPLNWLVFRLMGRVEWAWIAVPIIAIISGIIVVRMASLDIGFVRSRTEVALLEVHGGHSRAHMTRYTAVYSSLSTGYDFAFDDISSQSQPFATSSGGRQVSASRMENVVFQRDRGVRLNGVQVDSASVRMIHSEQMLSLGGAFNLIDSDGGWMLENDTDVNLRDVGVVYRDERDDIQVCWVGELSAHASPRRIRFESRGGTLTRLKEWDESLVTISHESQAYELMRRLDRNQDSQLSAKELESETAVLKHLSPVDSRTGPARRIDTANANDGELDIDELIMACQLSRDGMINLGEMLEVATETLELGRGEMRLVGWTDQELGGISIDPVASQTVQRTLVVVHLAFGEFMTAERDVNTWHDFNEANVIEFDESDQE